MGIAARPMVFGKNGLERAYPGLFGKLAKITRDCVRMNVHMYCVRMNVHMY